MFVNDKMLILIIFVIMIFMIGCCRKKVQVNYDYPPMIFWNNNIYNIHDESSFKVTKKDLHKKLGEILRVIDGTEKPKTNGTANMFEIGCNIYELKGKNEDEAIVIEFDNKYYIAYPYKVE